MLRLYVALGDPQDPQYTSEEFGCNIWLSVSVLWRKLTCKSENIYFSSEGRKVRDGERGRIADGIEVLNA